MTVASSSGNTVIGGTLNVIGETTLAGALNEGILETDTQFENLPQKISCAGKSIGEYDKKIPSNLTAEEILIRSGNIGSVRIAQKMGIDVVNFDSESSLDFNFL